MWIQFDSRSGALRAGAAASLALLLTACATTSAPPVLAPPPPPAFVAIPGLTPAERVEEAIQRLRRGHAEQARAELTAALADDPAHQRAQRLLAILDADPVELLGEKHYAYKVRHGETLWSLSQRLLGDPLLFYALARYNGVFSPEAVGEGRVLMIPGTPKRAAAAPSRRAAAKPATASAQARAADPAQASRLRRTALEHMNRGQIDKAEVLLKQARLLDPQSAAIAGDLDRARRIQATLRPRS